MTEETRTRRPTDGVAFDEPGVLGYLCPKLHGGGDLTWSEWEEHLWCYKCEIDYPSKDCPKQRPGWMSDEIWEMVNSGLPFKPVILPGPYPWTDW